MTTPARKVVRLRKPRAVKARQDETVGGIAAMLDDWLRCAREGEYRSVFVVGVRSDGSTFETSWQAGSEDVALMIGKLAQLQHKIMASRGD